LKKEEIKARAKGPDPEQIKAQAIVRLSKLTNLILKKLKLNLIFETG